MNNLQFTDNRNYVLHLSGPLRYWYDVVNWGGGKDHDTHIIIMLSIDRI